MISLPFSDHDLQQLYASAAIPLGCQDSNLVQKVCFEPWSDWNVFMLREDQWHSHINGNKWHKLKFNILQAKKENQSHIFTFGGPYSNHLYATASACSHFDLKAHVFIRGHNYTNPTPTLTDLIKFQAQLTFMDRAKYREVTRRNIPTSFKQSFARGYWVPEGGCNSLGVLGCVHWGNQIKNLLPNMDYWLLPLGTGATAAGLTASADCKVLAISVLKGNDSVSHEMSQWHEEIGCLEHDFEVLHGFHCGGYGKSSQELLDFIQQFYSATAIPLDPVYTGKMALACHKLLQMGHIPKGANILLIHTGGLQGSRGPHSERYTEK